MQVYVAKRWQIEHPLRNDAAITDDNDGISLESGQLSAELVVVPDAFGPGDGQFQLHSALFDRRGTRFKAPSFGPIRLRDNELNMKSCLYQFVECRHGKARCSAKHKIEGGGQ